MTEMDRALEADGVKLRQLTGEDHGPFESVEAALGDPVIGPSIQSLGILIAVEIAKQDQEIDNLGDGESIVFMGKCPVLNVVQLAEKIIAYQATERATLERRIAELETELENAHYEAMGDDL